MKQLRLNEDKRLAKFPVAFSIEIIEKIEEINWDNRDNPDALIEWHNYLDNITSYISNPVIAWDNMGRYQHSSNGKTHIKEHGFDITFMVKVNQDTKQCYVYVFDIDLKPEEFGLEVPSTVYENAIGKRIHSLIHEYISNRYPLTESVCKSVRMNERELHDMVGSIARRIVCEEYKVVGYDEDFDFGNGKTGHSLLTLSDGHGMSRVVEDDGCYVLYQKVGSKYAPATHIYPEAFNAMKKHLPNLPLH